MSRIAFVESPLCADFKLMCALSFHNYLSGLEGTPSGPDAQLKHLETISQHADMHSTLATRVHAHPGVVMQQHFKAHRLDAFHTLDAFHKTDMRVKWPQGHAAGLLSWKDKQAQFGESTLDRLAVMPTPMEASLWRACMDNSPSAKQHLDNLQLHMSMKARARLATVCSQQELVGDTT
jgi:hypothetical protein